MLSRFSFKGRVAVVTGAGRSLGRNYALALAQRGAAVVVNDVGGLKSGSLPWADSVADEIRMLGGDAVASHDNVATPDGGASLIDLAVRSFGTVDIVINNAGFLRPAMFGDISSRHVEDVIAVHLLAAFYVTQPAWIIMKEKAYGRVVFTSSSASFGQQANSHYAAAKEGLLALTRSLRLEGEPYGIKVNALLPYAVSDMVKENPILSPDLEKTRAVQQKMESRRKQDSVSALALVLASEECPVSGRAYSALAGRLARTFLANTEGWIAPDLDNLSPADIVEHLREIDDISRFVVPESIFDELDTTQKQLQAWEKKRARAPSA